MELFTTAQVTVALLVAGFLILFHSWPRPKTGATTADRIAELKQGLDPKPSDGLTDPPKPPSPDGNPDMIEYRTAEGAETEIRFVFDMIAKIACERWPAVMRDFKRGEQGE